VGDVCEQQSPAVAGPIVPPALPETGGGRCASFATTRAYRRRRICDPQKNRRSGNCGFSFCRRRRSGGLAVCEQGGRILARGQERRHALDRRPALTWDSTANGLPATAGIRVRWAWVSTGQFPLEALCCFPNASPNTAEGSGEAVGAFCKLLENLERAKGFEPSTPTLARSCSTPELHPHPGPGRRWPPENGPPMPKGGGVCNLAAPDGRRRGQNTPLAVR
jgi:hypothetical protein